VNNFFRRNQKKLLAILGSFLMVVFILPSTCGRGGMGAHEDPVVAYAGDEKIHASELAHAKADWEILKHTRSFLPPQLARQFQIPPNIPVPLTYQLGFVGMVIEQDPELFLLLQKEAEHNGIRVPPDRTEGVLREMNLSPNITPEESERWRHAVDGFLRVKVLYDRVTSNVKVSEPEVTHSLAQFSQDVQLNLVEFKGDGASPSTTRAATGPATAPTTGPTTAPTNEELEAFFRRYANRPAGLPTTNPAVLTFGYQRPAQVKLQYLTISKAQAREAVRKSKDPYEWEVLAQRYYLTHQPDFPATQPASKPATTTTASTTPASQPAASRPTTRPFQEVREEIMDKVMATDVDRLTKKVRDAVAERMTADWKKQRPQTSALATKPTTNTASTQQAAAPAATQPNGFGSFTYLEQLAADMQKQFGVLPAVTSKSEQWLTSDDLSKLQGIGSAHRPSNGQSFPNYVLQSAEPLMPVPSKADEAAVLSLLEPSQPLEDADGNIYLFRLTDAQAAHAPSGLAEVRDQVEADYRAAKAFERAVDQAKQFVDAAKKDGLSQAAAASGKQVIATGTIGRGMFGLPPTTVPNYPTTPESRQELIGRAYQLLSEATPTAPHPVAVIELPEERKVVVAELGTVTSTMPAEQMYFMRMSLAREMEFQQSQDLAADWFNADAIRSRLNYKPLDDTRKNKNTDRTKTASAG